MENKIPTTLEECYTYFENNWSTETKEDFKSIADEDLVFETHHSLGRNLRNNWGLWSSENIPSLVKFFKDLGVDHPDDMSGIIIESYHRKLNEKPFDLNNKINYLKGFYKNN